MTRAARTLTGLQLREWMKHRGYTHDEAADALGIARNSFLFYLNCTAVTECLRLAVIGYEAERDQPITGVTE